MVYKIRNKSFFMTPSGWKNNYNVKVLNEVTNIVSSQTYIIRSVEDANPYIRYFAQYRNISRKVKQFLYGDKDLENMVTMWMKERFNYVLNVETPIQLVQPAPDHRIISQGDRDYELILNNTHPYQFEFYKANNQNLQESKENQAIRDRGEKPLHDQFIDILGERIKHSKNEKGDELNPQELHRIFEDVFTLYKIAEGSQMSRTPRGDFNDFLEVRRPYIEPGVNNVSVKTD